MNVNPFSYLIEKLKSKVSKSGDTMSGNLTVDRQNGTTSATAWSAVVLGNNTPSGTDKNSFGVVRLYGENQAYTDLYAPNTTTQNRDITFPDKNGTIALTSDIPAPQLTSNPKTGMAGGWYVVWDLSVSWATDVSLWVQVASGTHVYVWTQNTLVTLA